MRLSKQRVAVCYSKATHILKGQDASRVASRSVPVASPFLSAEGLGDEMRADRHKKLAPTAAARVHNRFYSIAHHLTIVKALHIAPMPANFTDL